MEMMVSCSPLPFQCDSKSIIEEFLTPVSLTRLSFSAAGTEAKRLPTGVLITATATLDNPRSQEISYHLSWNIPDSCFSTLPPTDPSTTDSVQLTWEFVLAPGAEHRELQFTLTKTAALSGRVYSPDTVSVPCDSPPSAVQSLRIGQDSANQAFIGFTFPEVDTDLAKVILTRQDIQDTSAPGPCITETLDSDSDRLTTVPTKDILSDLSGSLRKRYYCPEVSPGHTYCFTVTLRDVAEQSSPTQSVGASSVSYTLAYDPNGGSSSEAWATSRYSYGSLVTVKPGPSWVDHSFTGWNTALNGTGVRYQPGDSITMNVGNLILYAQWSLKSSTLTFDTNGGSGSVSPVVAVTGSIVTLPNPTLTRAGYTFAGWNTAADGTGTSYTAGSGTFTLSANTTLYAKWTLGQTVSVVLTDPDTYTLTLSGIPAQIATSSPALTFSAVTEGAAPTSYRWTIDPSVTLTNPTTATVGIDPSILTSGTVYSLTLIERIGDHWYSGSSAFLAFRLATGETSIDSQGVVYSVSGTTCSVTSSPLATGAVVIPPSFGGYPVVAILTDAFKGNTAITSVTVPSTVTSIGAHAFRSCGNLCSVTFRGPKPTVGTTIFLGSSNLCVVGSLRVPNAYLADYQSWTDYSAYMEGY